MKNYKKFFVNFLSFVLIAFLFLPQRNIFAQSLPVPALPELPPEINLCDFLYGPNSKIINYYDINKNFLIDPFEWQKAVYDWQVNKIKDHEILVILNFWKHKCKIPFPQVIVTSPNGGEIWEQGKKYEIKWKTVNLQEEKVNIFLTTSSRLVKKLIVSNYPANLGNYSWLISSNTTPRKDYLIYIQQTTGNKKAFDYSDKVFEIIPAVDYPIQGSLYVDKNSALVGENIALTIEAKDANGVGELEAYYKDSWHKFDCSLKCSKKEEKCFGIYPEKCSFTFNFSEENPGIKEYKGYVIGRKTDGSLEKMPTVPPVLKVEIKEKTEREAYFNFTDGRDNFIFKLTDPKKIQEARDILVGKIKDRIHVMGKIIKQAVPYNSGWSFHLDPSSINFFEYATEVCDSSIRKVQDNLNETCANFLPGCIWCPWSSRLTEEVRPTPSITLILPNGGEILEKGKNYEIKWQSIGVDFIDITLLFNYGQGKQEKILLASRLPATGGVYLWNITPNVPSGDDYRIYISDALNGHVFDFSDGFFKIVEPSTFSQSKISLKEISLILASIEKAIKDIFENLGW